ncbi:hypothetical protein PR048_012730 [Dryococelus australis]|uniref:Uncharacterized protein n=1 Tax=Dryococelus australis TaxID=614101 RepID=A0ABQ9HQ83_9NEOP|nr:hypothetical protein PR048_012730 [Dryococelus australis]
MGEAENKVFNVLKYAISHPPVLGDCCSRLFASCTLNENEKHISAFEKEVIVCVWFALTWHYTHPKQVRKIGNWITKRYYYNSILCISKEKII